MKKENFKEAKPTKVILKCQRCGEERLEHSSDGSYFLDINTLEKYECGVREIYCHKCSDGNIGVFFVVGMQPE